MRLIGLILLAGCATPTHPKQCLDAPCGSCVDPRKDYRPMCPGEETCVEHYNGRQECYCAYEREGP